jgi:opine dehydrogenase
MRVAILGAGAIAYGAACYLSQAGHDPILWSPSGRRTAELAVGQPLVATGAIAGKFNPRIAASCVQCVAESDVVLFALPAYGHKFAFDAAGPHLREGQPVIVSSHLSFGALYLSRLLGARGIRTPIIAWGTTVTTGRQTSSTSVHVGTVRKEVDMATLPDSAADQGHAICTRLFGERFIQREGLLAIELSNVNPLTHLAITLFNLTRMEHGEEWSQAGNVTSTVGRLIEALDRERLAIAAAMGLKVKTVQEHIAMSNNIPIASVSEMSLSKFKQGPGVSGPKSIESRYVLEDVPFGLLPTVLLGRLAGTSTALHEAGIVILSAAYERDFANDNDILPTLELDGLSAPPLQALLRRGFDV